MNTRLLASLAFALTICASVAPGSFAQAEDPPPDTDTTEPAPGGPLNIRPAGIVQQPWEIGDAAIREIPSPIGPALTQTLLVEPGPYGAQASLFLDDKLERYSYDCPAGRCTGFATDLWQLVPRDQRLGYVNAVMDALMVSYPNGHIYLVAVQGGQAFVRMSWTQERGREYLFYPLP